MKRVKVVVSVLLIGLLLYHVDWKKLALEIGTLEVWKIAAAFLILAVQLPISTFKWQKALDVHELRLSFPFLQKVLCIAFFFNNFLPTSIGGDAYRVFRTLPKDGMKSRALSAIVLERLLGLAALIAIGCLGGLLVLGQHETTIVTYYLSACTIGGAILALLVVLLRKGLLHSLQERLGRIEKLKAFAQNFSYIKRGYRELLDIALVSLIFQVQAVLTIYLLFSAAGISIGMSECALIAAISALVGILPISINGIGVLEGSFVFVASELGVAFDQALLVAFLLRILVLPLSLICGVVYIIEPRAT